MPSKILGHSQSGGTRTLGNHFGEPASKSWWTERGSKGKLPSAEAIAPAIHYGLYTQPDPLVTRSSETSRDHVPPPPSASKCKSDVF